MNIADIAFVFGLILGTYLLICATFVYCKHREFGLGGTMLVIFGSLLVGLSIWTSIEISVNADGSVKAKYIREAKEDLGAKTADLYGDIEQLKINIVELSQDVLALKKEIPAATLPKEQIAKREIAERIFKQNSEYSILIFNKPYQQEVATKISKALLSVGFRSSATPTDLKEAVKQLKTNQAWVLYSQKGQEKLGAIKLILQESAHEVEFIYRDDPYELRNGDVQVLLF